MEGPLARRIEKSESDKAKSKEDEENNGRSKRDTEAGSWHLLGELLTLHAADLAIGGVIQDHECISTRFFTGYLSPLDGIPFIPGGY